MSLEFVNNSLLGLLALAVIPLLLHLFARTKPPVVEFSSVEFLRRIVKKTMRLKKPQDWILLILRTLAVLAVIGVFLRPLLFSDERLSGLFQKKNLVVIVDASASMAFVEGAQTRFASACAEAGEILSGLSSRDSANVIFLKAEPEAVFPDSLATNLGYLKEQLRRAKVTSERGANDRAVNLAINLLAETDGHREICIVSDFQRSGWEKFEPTLPEGVDLIHVKIGSRDAENVAVTNLTLEPTRPILGESISVSVEVTNFSAAEVQTTLFSEVGEGRRSQNITVPVGEKTTAVFHHTLTESGPVVIRTSLAEDSFPGDDQRFASVEVRPFLRVGVFSKNGDPTTEIWKRAAQSLGWAVQENSDPLENVGDLDVLLLADWDGEFDDKIPPETKAIALPAIGENSLLGTVVLESSESGFDVSISKDDDPIFDLFRKGEFGNPAGTAGSARLKAGGKQLPETATTLLAYQNDGEPALIRLAANRYVWLAPLSSESGNWGSRVEFLPFFAELLLADRAAASGVLSGLDFEPGDAILWTSDQDFDVTKLVATGHDNTALEFNQQGANRFLTASVSSPGIVEWKLNDDLIGNSAVNFPAGESDLKTLTLAETEGSAAVAVSGGSEVRYLRDGMKLWPALLAAAVIFLLFEVAVTLWAARTA